MIAFYISWVSFLLLYLYIVMGSNIKYTVELNTKTISYVNLATELSLIIEDFNIWKTHIKPVQLTPQIFRHYRKAFCPG